MKPRFYPREDTDSDPPLGPYKSPEKKHKKRNASKKRGKNKEEKGTDNVKKGKHKVKEGRHEENSNKVSHREKRGSHKENESTASHEEKKDKHKEKESTGSPKKKESTGGHKEKKGKHKEKESPGSPKKKESTGSHKEKKDKHKEKESTGSHKKKERAGSHEVRKDKHNGEKSTGSHKKKESIGSHKEKKDKHPEFSIHINDKHKKKDKDKEDKQTQHDDSKLEGPEETTTDYEPNLIARQTSSESEDRDFTKASPQIDEIKTDKDDTSAVDDTHYDTDAWGDHCPHTGVASSRHRHTDELDCVLSDLLEDRRKYGRVSGQTGDMLAKKLLLKEFNGRAPGVVKESLRELVKNYKRQHDANPTDVYLKEILCAIRKLSCEIEGLGQQSSADSEDRSTFRKKLPCSYKPNCGRGNKPRCCANRHLATVTDMDTDQLVEFEVVDPFPSEVTKALLGTFVFFVIIHLSFRWFMGSQISIVNQ